ncbi:winged helix-turn-helix domain-containing protein [Oceanirhabdus sp. W0125-5]|uniref:winged helix-turn-helix domain-containing protein n=1 Tax=Oceanirhabdus sp. W0125-5 TaxID=2999116 RepID=UPI0022F2B622|nr:crosslink repair DNA glycosylase YcaQ family protein [Oceanirhabdus sp. W0125-5]WBW98212.1 winged helix DNA-binding domain-containing protein [Oceanirhabdus sp. W0125-5]
MNEMKITKAEAREFLVNYHGLGSTSTFEGEEGILKYMKRVGCIQYDPLNVVGRNPDLVLQSRIPGYSSLVLEKMLYSDRSLIDGWDKMMAIYRQEDWPFFRRVRKRKEESIKATLRNRGSIEALELTGQIRDILVAMGPLQASKINIGTGGKGRWGHRKLSSAALDYMFNIGELGIYGKNNTQKIYDLVENILPNDLIESPDPFVSDRDFYKWYFKRRIGSVGILWGCNGGGWLGHFLSDKALRTSILEELEKQKSIVSLSIEGIDETFYMRTEDIKILDYIREKTIQENNEGTMRFLAPLDNLLWDRAMIEDIFGFKYSWEVYVPKDKRKFGYYVLPVLYGNEFVARFEPEMHRGNKPLEIKNWWWEEGITVTEEMKFAVKKALKSFCEYLGTEGVHVESLNKIF